MYKNTPKEAQVVINKMFAALEGAGWQVIEVFDGEETERVSTRVEAIEVIDSVEESVVKFKKGNVRHNVVLIPINGKDVICDHSCSDTDDFESVMDSLMED